MGNPRVLSVAAITRQGIGNPAPPGLTQDVEDHVALFCQLAGGASFALEIAWASNIGGLNSRFILGERAGLRFAPLTLFSPPDPGSRQCGEQRLLEGEDGDGGGLPGIVAGMVTALDGGPPPMTPASDALQVTRVIDAAYRSAAAGAPVRLDDS
jgi:predicted dehydrogenase